MKSLWVVVLAVSLAFCVPLHAAEPSGEEIFKAIVKIRATIPKEATTASTLGTEREGNGVVIDTKGHILTTGYVIVEAETLEVMGPDGRAVGATFVGYYHSTGLGILRTDKPLDVTPLKLGDSSKVGEGDPVLVVGYGGSDAAIGARVVSRKEFAGYWEYILDEAIFTAPAYADFAGAALIGRDGRLLGIGSLFTQVAIQGLGSLSGNVFIPIDLLNPILDDLIKNGRSSKPPRPWLGVNAEETHGRVIVTKVAKGSPADKAGLHPGDVILTVDGKTVNGLADFYRKVWALGNAGVDVPLSALQGIRVREFPVHSLDRLQFLMLKPKKLI
jgi:S1-C subfamily serine protease